MASTYSTWEYYHGTYRGSADEDEYAQLSLLCAMEIDRLTLGEATKAPEVMQERLALCECRMVDSVIASNELSVAPGVASVSNDGFSVSFKDGDASAANRREIVNIARELLTYPVNLLYRGAVIRRDYI